MAHPGGRPLKFKSPEELVTKIEAYKKHIAKSKEPATITGLAVFLGTSRETLVEYEERDQFVDAIKEAKTWVQHEYERRALMNQSNATFTIFSLKNNFGWKDKTETDVTSGGEKIAPVLVKFLGEEHAEIEIPIEFKRLFDTDWREAAVYGGRYSMKSHTVARFLLIRSRQQKTRVACFREFQNSIAESSHQLLSDLIAYYGMTDFRVTDNSIINTVNGSDFLFKGLHHNEQSVKSIEGIDIAWVEEAQTVSKTSLEVLTPTIRKPGSQIVYTYNRLFEDDPVHTRLVVEGRPNTLVINVNYDIALKYGYMPDAIRLEMEDDEQHRPGLFRHKWLGEPNTTEGRIYKDWQVIETVPHEARLERYGLDFGYSNDPTAIVAIYYYNGGYILDEITYQKGLSNKQIADIFLNLDQRALVMADSAEPKSIDELKLYGVNVLPCTKGRDSVTQGIQYVQDQRISVTKHSINLLKEYRNYMWETDKEGRILNVPTDQFNHAMDALRYGMENLRGQTEPMTEVGVQRGLGGVEIPIYDF